jgi:hypothetical protein
VEVPPPCDGDLARRHPCEHVFVTSQGSAYSQFRRALDRRNLLVAWSLAAEIPKVALADALALLLLALDEQPWRFDMAASRWHGRLCTEARLTSKRRSSPSPPSMPSVAQVLKRVPKRSHCSVNATTSKTRWRQWTGG